MCRNKLSLYFMIAISAALLLDRPAVVSAQRAGQSYKPSFGNHAFPKGFAAPTSQTKRPSVNRSAPRVSSSTRSSGSNKNLSANRSTRNSSPNYGSSRDNYSNRNRNEQYNNRANYPSRSSRGNGFNGYSGYGNRALIIGNGFGTPLYSPYFYANRYSGFGTQFYEPAYSTYGTYLNTGGSYGVGPVDSSVAGQAYNRLVNGQPVVPRPYDPDAAALEAENLRLQIELERARQQLAQQNQGPLPVQQTLKPVVVESPDNSNVIDQLGLAAIIETSELAKASQLKAERAFRGGNYGQAARFAALAVSLDEPNGKLKLFATQAHFANGEYREAFESLQSASSLLTPDELGFVVDNFKLFYGQNDFVSQTRALSTHLQQSPNDADAWMLRGFQYGALGFPDAASKDFEKAASLGSDQSLIDVLQKRFVPTR